MTFHEKAMLKVITNCIENFKKKGETNEKELEIMDDALDALFEEYEKRNKERKQMNNHERRMINSIVSFAECFKEYKDDKKICLDCISSALKELYEELGEEHDIECAAELQQDSETKENNKMTDKVKKELEKTIAVINKDLIFVLEGKLPTEELIKLQFSAIRDLVDYCEALVLKGEEAIE